jgi:hypothetical protein
MLEALTLVGVAGGFLLVLSGTRWVVAILTGGSGG